MQLPDVDHVKGYIIPRGEIQRLGIPEISSVRNKAKYSFIDTVVKRENKVKHSPDKYALIDKWCDPTANGANRPKGAFMKSPRTTISEQIFYNEKREAKPAPSKYTPLKSYNYTLGKKPGNYEQKCHSKSICYTDENANTYLENPGPSKYTAVKLEVIKSKSFKWDHTRKTKEIGIRLNKISKDDRPSPSSYKTDQAFKTT